jgi:hypothetical protein
MDEKQLKLLLAQTDWAVLSDVELANKQEFIDYRSNIRYLLLNDMYYNEVIEPPEPVWATESSE